jgi:hypothetical protein
MYTFLACNERTDLLMIRRRGFAQVVVAWCRGKEQILQAIKVARGQQCRGCRTIRARSTPKLSDFGQERLYPDGLPATPGAK